MRIRGHVEIFAYKKHFVHVVGWFRASEERLTAEVPRLIVTMGAMRYEVSLHHLRNRVDLPAQGDLPAGRGFQVLFEVQQPADQDPAILISASPKPEDLGAETSPFEMPEVKASSLEMSELEASVFISLDGEETSLNPPLLQATPFQPRGNLEISDRDGFQGWVLDVPDAVVLLHLEGVASIPVTRNQHRPDLPIDGGLELPLLGFHLTSEAFEAAVREHSPETSLRDVTTRQIVLLSSDVELLRRSINLRSDLSGLFDRSTNQPRSTPLRGHIEIFARRGNFLHVAGWFRAPAERLAIEVPRLLITWGDESREISLRRTRDRGDLPAQGKLPSGYGFQVLLEMPDTNMDASAILVLGEDKALFNPSVLQATLFQPRGTLDILDHKGVRGWVLDAPGSDLFLLLDGAELIPVSLNLQRPDLPFDNGSSNQLFGFHLPMETLIEALRESDPNGTFFDGRTREITLIASGQEIARRDLSLRRDFTGKLERAEEGEAVGWLVERGRPYDIQDVDLLIDGTRWATVTAGINRPDLAQPGLAYRGGGFRVALPHFHPGKGGPLRIEAVPRHAAAPLSEAVVLESLPAWRKHRGETAFRMSEKGLPPVAIVVPIYNAAAELDRCLISLMRHTTGPARLILVDDASPQPEVAEILQRWEDTPGIEIHRNSQNLGFTSTANLGITLAGRDDVVLLNSDTVVGPGWLTGLRTAAYSGPCTGTATAVSNNSGVFSVPELNTDNVMPPWFSVDDMARLVRSSSLSIFPVVPTGHGFCLYIRRACLEIVGMLDEAAFPRGYGEENDFCMRAARAGFENVLDDRTFVWHQRSASFGKEKILLNAAGSKVLKERYPEYSFLTSMFATNRSMLTVRWRVRQALEHARTAGGTPRPRILFVISTESGGTPQTNRDLMDSLASHYEPWVLRCDSRILSLSRHTSSKLQTEQGGFLKIEEEHLLERPIEPASHGSGEYDQIVSDIILRYGFELVHIRHIAWHGIGITHVCHRLDVPVVFSFHDFYTACPVTKLLDAEGRFCGGPCTDGEADCTAELWRPDTVPPLRHRYVHRWQAMMAETLQFCDAFVTTSPSARATMVANYPFLAERDFRIISHGRSFPRLESLGAEPHLGERLRVLVPGNVSGAKGAGLVAAMAALDCGREIEFHVLGGVDSSLSNTPGVFLHGRYSRADFAGYVARIQPHIGIVLSLWPETYCHTLTECWAAGLPVMATALGALAERIGADGGGWLIDRWMESEAMLAELQRLRRAPQEIRARRNEVLDWQARTGRHRDNEAMATEYDCLYREVLDRRRSFRVEAVRPRIILAIDQPQLSSFPSALPTPLAVATRNAVSRPFIFRSVHASFPFGDPAMGPADAVLVAPGALTPDDFSALRAHCATIKLPLLEADAGVTSRGVDIGIGIEQSSWLLSLPPVPTANVSDLQEVTTSCRVLYAHSGNDAQLAALRPLFEDLAALGVATLSVLGGSPTAGWYHALEMGLEDGVAALRRTAHEHEIGLAEKGPSYLALQAIGLPVLVISPALTATADETVEAERDLLLRRLTELSVDVTARAAMAVESRRTARTIIMENTTIQDIDRRLHALLKLTQAGLHH